MLASIVNPKTAKAQRIALVPANAEHILRTYVDAQAKLGPDAIVVVAHRADAIGSQFAAQVDNRMRAAFGRQHARRQAKAWGDLVFAAVPRIDAAVFMADANPDVARGIQTAQPGALHVLVIAYQGSTFAPVVMAADGSLECPANDVD